MNAPMPDQNSVGYNNRNLALAQIYLEDANAGNTCLLLRIRDFQNIGLGDLFNLNARNTSAVDAFDTKPTIIVIHVNTVPEPSIMLLFGSVIADGLARDRRRQSAPALS